MFFENRATILLLLLVLAAAGRMPAQCPLGTLGSTPVVVTCSSSTFQTATTPAVWNAYGLYSTANYDLGAGTALSLNQPQGAAFLIANGTLGAIPNLLGTIVRAGGSASAVFARASATPLPGFGLGATYAQTLPAAVPLALFQFTVTAPNNYGIRVDATDPSLRFAVFDSGVNTGWRPRQNSAGEFFVGVSGTYNLGLGTHALVVFRQPTSSGAAASLSISVACGGAPTSLSASTTLSISNGCFPFSVSPVANRWNVVALASYNEWSFDLGAASGNTLSQSALCVAASDGRHGTPTTTSGTALKIGPYTTPTRLRHRTGNLVLPLDWTAVAFSPPADPLEVLEFTVTEPGTYQFGVEIFAVDAQFHFVVFGPAADGEWRGAGSALAAWSPPAPAYQGGFTVALGAGVHALAIVAAGGLPTFYLPLNVQAVLVPNPTPSITSLAPSRAVAGTGAFTMTVDGTGFVPQSVVQWNGVALPTSFVSATQLTATVSAALANGEGLVPVTVLSPTPGGGTSPSATFTLALPSITALTPFSIPPMVATSAPITLQIQGADFVNGCQVVADGQPLATTWYSPTLVHCVLGPALPSSRYLGGIALAVQNPGRHASNARALLVGAGTNRGTIVRIPLAPGAGEAYAVRLEGGVPSAPLTMAVSLGPPVVQSPWPSPAVPMILSLDVSAMLPVVDGIGVFGPASGFGFAAAPPPNSSLAEALIPGFVAPNPSFGIDLTVQAAHLDPASPLGFLLCFARYPDRL